MLYMALNPGISQNKQLANYKHLLTDVYEAFWKFTGQKLLLNKIYGIKLWWTSRSYSKKEKVELNWTDIAETQQWNHQVCTRYEEKGGEEHSPTPGKDNAERSSEKSNQMDWGERGYYYY